MSTRIKTRNSVYVIAQAGESTLSLYKEVDEPWKYDLVLEDIQHWAVMMMRGDLRLVTSGYDPVGRVGTIITSPVVQVRTTMPSEEVTS